MAIANYLKPGDKIDIHFLHQTNGKVYKSGVFDFLSDNEIEILMPTDGGKMVMFNVGFECLFYFFTDKGTYTAEAIITNRYKRDNFYLLSAKLRSAIKKFQRREYFRLECLIDFSYYSIPQEVIKTSTPDEVIKTIVKPEYNALRRLGTTKDISGGGMRFTTMEKLEIGSKVLSVIQLSNEKMDHMFYLITDIISCDPVESMPGLWVARGKFKFRNKNERDWIIRYVFEEDRIRRRKENW